MQTLTFLFAFIAVLALIGVAAWLVRRFANNRLGANTQRGRMPRLAVIDAAAVDGRRRLVLVRRDNVEHLLMIGGPSDIVVEPNIVRAMPGRDRWRRARRSASSRRGSRRCPMPPGAKKPRGLTQIDGRIRSCRTANARAAAAPLAPHLRRRTPPPGAAADAGASQRSADRLCAGVARRPRRTGPAAPAPRRTDDAPAAARERAAQGATS